MRHGYLATSKGPLDIIVFKNQEECDSYAEGDKWRDIAEAFGSVDMMYESFSLSSQLASRKAYTLRPGSGESTLDFDDLDWATIFEKGAFLAPKEKVWKDRRFQVRDDYDPEKYPSDQYVTLYGCALLARPQRLLGATTFAPKIVVVCYVTFLYPKNSDVEVDPKYVVPVKMFTYNMTTQGMYNKIPPEGNVATDPTWAVLQGGYFGIGMVIENDSHPVFTVGQFFAPAENWQNESKWMGYTGRRGYSGLPQQIDNYDFFTKGFEKMFQPRIATLGIGIYKMNKEEVQNFFSGLWHTTWDEVIGKFFGQSEDGILALRWFYGIKNDITERAKHYVKIGTTQLTEKTGAPVTGILCKDEFIKHMIDNIAVARVHNNYLDFAPYTQVSIFIPFYGYIDIDPAACVGGWIRLVYDISLFTGIASVKIYTKRNEKEDYILYNVVTAQVSVDIPVNAQGVNDLGARVANGVISAATNAPYALAGLATGGIGAIGIGASIASVATAGASGAIGGASGNVTHSGGLPAEVSIISGMRVKVLITTVMEKRDLSAVVGKPDYSSKKIGDCDGFIKVLKINDTPGGCKYDKDIEALLKEGVFK